MSRCKPTGSAGLSGSAAESSSPSLTTLTNCLTKAAPDRGIAGRRINRRTAAGAERLDKPRASITMIIMGAPCVAAAALAQGATGRCRRGNSERAPTVELALTAECQEPSQARRGRSLRPAEYAPAPVAADRQDSRCRNSVPWRNRVAACAAGSDEFRGWDRM